MYWDEDFSDDVNVRCVNQEICYTTGMLSTQFTVECFRRKIDIPNASEEIHSFFVVVFQEICQKHLLPSVPGLTFKSNAENWPYDERL